MNFARKKPLEIPNLKFVTIGMNETVNGDLLSALFRKLELQELVTDYKS